jgi:hypothetical protein
MPLMAVVKQTSATIAHKGTADTDYSVVQRVAIRQLAVPLQNMGYIHKKSIRSDALFVFGNVRMLGALSLALQAARGCAAKPPLPEVALSFPRPCSVFAPQVAQTGRCDGHFPVSGRKPFTNSGQ